MTTTLNNLRLSLVCQTLQPNMKAVEQWYHYCPHYAILFDWLTFVVHCLYTKPCYAYLVGTHCSTVLFVAMHKSYGVFSPVLDS